MALNDVQIRTAKLVDKQYKLTDSEGMHHLVHATTAPNIGG
jgi:hypothetical protein